MEKEAHRSDNVLFCKGTGNGTYIVLKFEVSLNKTQELAEGLSIPGQCHVVVRDSSPQHSTI